MMLEHKGILKRQTGGKLPHLNVIATCCELYSCILCEHIQVVNQEVEILVCVGCAGLAHSNGLMLLNRFLLHTFTHMLSYIPLDVHRTLCGCS